MATGSPRAEGDGNVPQWYPRGGRAILPVPPAAHPGAQGVGQDLPPPIIPTGACRGKGHLPVVPGVLGRSSAGTGTSPGPCMVCCAQPGGYQSPALASALFAAA